MQATFLPPQGMKNSQQEGITATHESTKCTNAQHMESKLQLKKSFKGLGSNSFWQIGVCFFSPALKAPAQKQH